MKIHILGLNKPQLFKKGNDMKKGDVMKKLIMIHAAEGGTDSKLFTNDLANAYLKLATRKG